MLYHVEFTPPAVEELGALPKHVQTWIVRRIDPLEENPRQPRCRKLRGSDSDRRVHASRDRVILYRIKDDATLVLVVRVTHRGEVYRHLPKPASMDTQVAQIRGSKTTPAKRTGKTAGRKKRRTTNAGELIDCTECINSCYDPSWLKPDQLLDPERWDEPFRTLRRTDDEQKMCHKLAAGRNLLRLGRLW